MNHLGKILFINNNMKIGGVQKALLEVLKAIHQDYDVTLLLFQKTGALLEQIPEDVTVLETRSHYRYLGLSQGECKTRADQMVRGFYALLSKTLGISSALRIMDLTAGHDLPQCFDASISFLQCGRFKSCYGGTAEYALSHTRAGKHICWIHCDYLHSGTCSRHSLSVYRRFDRIVCVSRSVREAFIQKVPELKEQTHVLYNPVDTEQILRLSRQQPWRYPPDTLNLLTLARLASEKGIDRLIRVVARIDGLHYYIVGAGPMKETLQQLIAELGIADRVFLLGEQENPYRFLAGADLLAVPSYHEAAPVVFQEAAVLGVPVLTTRTLSADEMIPPSCGFVVDNSESALEECLCSLVKKPLSVQKTGTASLDDSAAGFRVRFSELIESEDA